MARDPILRRRGDCLAPTALRFLDHPLEFIAEDHLREREICARLDRIAEGIAPEPAGVADTLAFLRSELPLHLQDEEQDLFPLLQKRCAPEDEIDKVLTRLRKDHGHSNADTPKVIALLERLSTSPRAPTPAECHTLHDYALHARRHLILENAIVLPLARVRLSKRDQRRLTNEMSKRRGLGT